jgi:SAM-dependent methyltransferase
MRGLSLATLAGLRLVLSGSAGVVQWQNVSFPSLRRGFDSPHPLHRYHARVTERFSFETVDAADYEELRPGYAPEAVAWVAERGGLVPGSRVVDLAAGTGLLSRRFVALGADVVGVEPASNMRAVLAKRVPEVRVVDGTAESIPLDDASVDAVVVANAFHHFARAAAFAEIRRVLRPGGTLALFWAWMLEERSPPYPWIREVETVVGTDPASRDISAAYRTWRRSSESGEGFGPFERREFPMSHTIASARIADLYATSSDVASLPIATRDALLDRIRALSVGQPQMMDLAGKSVVDLCSRDDGDDGDG